MLTHQIVLHGGPYDNRTWSVTGSSHVICIPLDKKGVPDPRGRLDSKFGWLEYRRQPDGRFVFQGEKT